MRRQKACPCAPRFLQWPPWPKSGSGAAAGNFRPRGLVAQTQKGGIVRPRGGAGPVTFTGRAVSGMKRCACCQAAGSGPIMRHRYLDRVAAFNGLGRGAGPKPRVMQCRMPLRPVRVRTVPVDFDKGEDAWQMRGKARWGCQTGCRPIGEMARPERFELPTTWFVARYSIQLSYGRLAGSKRSRDCPY